MCQSFISLVCIHKIIAGTAPFNHPIIRSKWKTLLVQDMSNKFLGPCLQREERCGGQIDMWHDHSTMPLEQVEDLVSPRHLNKYLGPCFQREEPCGGKLICCMMTCSSFPCTPDIIVCQAKQYSINHTMGKLLGTTSIMAPWGRTQTTCYYKTPFSFISVFGLLIISTIILFILCVINGAQFDAHDSQDGYVKHATMRSNYLQVQVNFCKLLKLDWAPVLTLSAVLLCDWHQIFICMLNSTANNLYLSVISPPLLTSKSKSWWCLWSNDVHWLAMHEWLLKQGVVKSFNNEGLLKVVIVGNYGWA